MRIGGNNKSSHPLVFGTGGLRGIIGAGADKINVLTVARATRGLADYLKNTGGVSVCIAYDTRNMSKQFAETAMSVLVAQGIRVFYFSDVRPTPMLSFAVRYKNADAGIVITASHNPKEYNGYKVYGPDGGQITDKMADEISLYISKHETLEEPEPVQLDTLGDRNLIECIDSIDSIYYDKVMGLSLRKEIVRRHARELKILFTPLHGTGNIPIRHVLTHMGFTGLEVVEEQAEPNGNFPTVKTPNPEDESVFECALNKAKESQYDLIVATDPDCDRVGILILDGAGDYIALSGNEIGVLLSEYIIAGRMEQGILGQKPAIIKTIVTTSLVNKIAEEYGVHVEETLTGFKYIGEKNGEWETTKERDFVFGFEESYGYLTGDFVRDKDAVIATALIAEMVLYYRLQQKTLVEKLHELYGRYGYSKEMLVSKVLDESSNIGDVSEYMEFLRRNYSSVFSEEILACCDYKASIKENLITGEKKEINLPKSDVLKLVFIDDSWLAVRPSGTEPKIKYYLGVSAKSSNESDRRMQMLIEYIDVISACFLNR